MGGSSALPKQRTTRLPVTDAGATNAKSVGTLAQRRKAGVGGGDSTILSSLLEGIQRVGATGKLGA